MADTAVRCALSVIEDAVGTTNPSLKEKQTVSKYPSFNWNPVVTVDTSAFKLPERPPKLPTFTKDLRLLLPEVCAGAVRPRPCTPPAIMPPTPMEYDRAKENINVQMRTAYHGSWYPATSQPEMMTALMKQEAWRLAELRQCAASCLARIR